MKKFVASAFLSLFALVSGIAFAAPTCEHNPKRAAEMAQFDDELIQDYVSHRGEASVPEALRRQLARLQAASPTLHKKAPVQLRAYKHPRINAHAADHGFIVLTSAVWEGDRALNEDETAAILAHELAHIEMRHSLAAGCEALSHMGTLKDQVTLKSAMIELGIELFNSQSDLAVSVRHSLHERELSADHRGIELMRRAGFNPKGMVSVLTKLHQGNPSEGAILSAGSHPDADARIHAARTATSGKRIALQRVSAMQ